LQGLGSIPDLARITKIYYSKKKYIYLKNKTKRNIIPLNKSSWAPVAHVYNPRYSQEAEIRRITVQSQPGQIVLKNRILWQ
jgi:hypothetical protein